jgi:hypothetical protein
MLPQSVGVLEQLLAAANSLRRTATPVHYFTGLFRVPGIADSWTTEPIKIPRWANAPAAFYDPKLNVHFYHVATDNYAGTMYAYRYKQARKN